MAWTLTDLGNIEAAIATGQLTVRHGDTLVHYRSIPELIKARETIKASLENKPSRTVASFSSGIRGTRSRGWW